MSEFNPYFHWLNFTGKEKPDTYYELLGLKHGEKDVQKIAERIDFLTQQIQQKGPESHFPEWNQLLTEFQVAKNCLCNPKYKAEYDAKHPAPLAQPQQSVAQPGMMAGGMAQQGMMGMPQQGMVQPGMMAGGMAQQGMMGMPQQGMIQPGMVQPGMMAGGMAQQGMMGMPQQGMVQPGMVQPGMMAGGMAQQGVVGMPQQGMIQPGMVQQGMPQQGMVQPGMMAGGMAQQGVMGMSQPGMVQQGMTQPGMVQPGMMVGGMAQQGASFQATPTQTAASNDAPIFTTSASSGKGGSKASKNKHRKASGPSPAVRNIIALVGLVIVAGLAWQVFQKISGKDASPANDSENAVAQSGEGNGGANSFDSFGNSTPQGNAVANTQDAAQPEITAEDLAVTETPDFDAIVSYLQNYAFEDAKKLISKGMKMTLQKDDSERLERLKTIAKNMEEFHTSVANHLNKYVPPMELCDGQYSLVESGNGKAVIRIAGKNFKFSMESPVTKGHDLYDIIYRNQYAKAFEAGNMLYAIQYAIFQLMSPTGDRAKAEKLISKILEKGSDKDRETMAQIMTEFGINGLGLMTNMALDDSKATEEQSAADADSETDDANKANAEEVKVETNAEEAQKEESGDSGKSAGKTKSKKSRKKAKSAKGAEVEGDSEKATGKDAEKDAEAQKAEDEEKARQEEERKQARRKDEWRQLTNSVRQDISWRKIPAAKKTLAKLEDLAETPENKEELDRLIALSDYMDSFVTWVGGRMGGFQWGSVHKSGDIEFSVVECGPGFLVIHDQGVNKRYTVNDLNPKLVAWVIGTPKEADDFVLYGTYLAMAPDGDRAKARSYWNSAQSKGFDKDSIALIMKELDVPLPDSGKRPVQLNTWNPRGKAPVGEQTIPTGADYDDALAKLKKEFARDYAKSEMRDQVKLAEKFVKMAQLPARSAAEAYVMTEEAIRLAKNHAFYETVFQAYLVQESRFQRDTYQDRLELVQNAKADVRGASSMKELANCALEMGFDAVKRQKKIEANQMLNIARANAKGAQIQRARELERNISMMK